jgi:NAD(P)-dependent dehydrogenase (short-subunit alcohol dehydrogenase family)
MMAKDKQVALVTGAGQGIGRGISVELAKNGFDIAAVDIVFEPENKQKGLFEVKERVEELGSIFLPIQGDVSSLKDHEKILKQVLDRFGKIDVLVNNAGVAPEKRLDVLETTPESYDRLLSINARGPFFLTQKIANQMVKRAEKSPGLKPCIIFISSISADVSSPSRAEYCVSKAALSQAARIFADRLSEYGINVFEVRPGIIQTDMTAPVQEKYDKLIDQGLVPQKRWGFPEDVGKAVASLAKGDFGYSTGLVIEVSGGMNIRHL